VPVIWLLCMGGVAYYHFAFLYISISRIDYPFALEWLEGTSFIQVHRILSGNLLYVDPSLTYVPLMYPPLYYYACALLARLVGLSFLPLRLVSLLSTLGSIAIICALVRLRSQTILPSLISAGFFAATFRIGGAWFDIARVDMLAVLLMSLSLYLASLDHVLTFVLGGILIAMACLAKQTIVIVLAAMCLYALVLRPEGKTRAFVLSALLTYGLSYVVLDRLHGGWYRFFVFELPSSHDMLREISMASDVFWTDILISTIPIIGVFSISFFILSFRERHRQGFRMLLRSDEAYLLTAFLATILVSWSGLANPGGYDNVLVPAFAASAIASGLGLDKLLRISKQPYMRAGYGVLCIIQFVLLYYPLSPQIPTTADLGAGNRLLSMMREQPGDVLVPYHPELALMAGKPAYANYIAMYDLEGGQGGGDEDLWSRVRSQLTISFKRHRFSLIVLDKEQFWGSPGRYYESSDLVFEGDAFFPVTGWRTRPVVLYRRVE